MEIGEEVANLVVQQLIARKRNLRLSDLAFQVAQGFKKQEDLEAFLTETREPISFEDISYVSTDLGEIVEKVYSSPGMRWKLDCLNKSLGSLRRGDFGFIFARPESGKTTFIASECAHFLSKGVAPIVWFNNEEQGDKVMLRVYQAYFGVTVDHLLASPKKFSEEFNSKFRNKFFLIDRGIITKTDVEKIVAKFSPALVVYDQIDKIKGFTSDREDLKLGAIYQWARELAKGTHAAIGVCQADGHGEGVRYLTMEHVSNAKTSKQAEADFIIGIGKSHDDGMEYARFLNISKNKLIGDKDSIPDLRHGRFEVLIKPEVAQYEDIIKFE